MKNPNPDKALIISDNDSILLEFKPLLQQQGYEAIDTDNGHQAAELFQRQQHNIIFMDAEMLNEADGYETTRQIKDLSGNRFVPIIFLISNKDEMSFRHCIKAGGNDFLIRPFDIFMLQFKIHAMQHISSLNQEVQGMYSMIHREQEIAESVFIDAIQGANISNPMIKSKVRPAGTFSGDLILSAYSPSRDLFVLIGDFTGHGLSAALGAMPVSEVFHAMTTKGFSPENILNGINKKLQALLPVGMFFGVQLVVISPGLDHACIFNAGMPDLLVIEDYTNSIKHRVKSAGLPLGVIAEINPREFREFVRIDANDKILMFSDGLTEARNAEDEEFGDERLQTAINRATENNIYNQIFDDLDQFAGDMTQIDDVTLVEITCVHELIPRVGTQVHKSGGKKSIKDSGEWQLSLKYSGARLRETNPVPILVNQIMEMEELEDQRQSLFTVITELYVNALDHGVLGLDSALKSDPVGFAKYFEERETRLKSLNSGHVFFELSVEQIAENRSIQLRIEDSGDGFDYENFQTSEDNTLLGGRGILLVEALCSSLTYEGSGNIVKAAFQLNKA